MKKQKQNVKRTIKKKIDLKHKHMGLPTPKSNEDRVKLRNQPKQKNRVLQTPMVNVDLISDKDKVRFFGTKNVGSAAIKINPYYEVKDYGKYVKQKDVDCDAIMYVPTYNRFEYVDRLLNQIFTQETKYSFKVILHLPDV